MFDTQPISMVGPTIQVNARSSFRDPLLQKGKYYWPRLVKIWSQQVSCIREDGLPIVNIIRQLFEGIIGRDRNSM